jgi:aspartokinase/homoserine dehydrogenase 1
LTRLFVGYFCPNRTGTMLVMKFGGTSVGSAERILQLIEIVRQHQHVQPLVVVVSAMSGVTNLLEEASLMASRQEEGFRMVLESIARKHDECIGGMRLSPTISAELIKAIREPLARLGEICKGLFLVGDLTPKTKAHIMSYGELLASRIVQAGMANAGLHTTCLDSRQLIITDSTYPAANVDFELTNLNIKEAIKGPTGIYILPGYISRSKDGNNTTLGRGGSDYTAAIVAAALHADRLEIWTDVNGMLSADPRLVRDTITIPMMSYEEAMELSYFGAKVIYPPTIQPAMAQGMRILIKNSFEPTHPGTLISNEPYDGTYFVKGLTSIQDIALLTVTGPGMMGTAGFADRLFYELGTANISVLLITQSSSEHTLCLAIHRSDAVKAQALLQSAYGVNGKVPQQTFKIEENLALVAVVGDGMRQRAGIAGKIFSLLGENGINLRAIAQGSNERNISFIVSQHNVSKALNVLHEGFFLSKYKTIHLFILGVGNVGAQLMEQIKTAQQKFLQAGSLDIKVCGMANSKQMILDASGISLNAWEADLKQKGIGLNLRLYAERMQEFNLRNSILIDVTASDDTSMIYMEALSHNIHVVTANKVAASSSFDFYKQLKETSAKHTVKFLNETNVGAGLPVIKTIRDLVLTGDRIHRIEAVLSGSLNYIFDRIGSDGALFSQAVTEAREHGYTEPNPSLDLSGKDVMRKMLILARETGLELEMKDIKNKPFLPGPTLEADDWTALLHNLQALDQQMDDNRKRLAAINMRWRYMATLENGQVMTGLEEIDETHPAYHLKGTDNIILIWTDRYKHRPMVIAGAGAGPDVTASGVLADVISIANV